MSQDARPRQVMLDLPAWIALLRAALIADAGIPDEKAGKMARKILRHVCEWGGADVSVLKE